MRSLFLIQKAYGTPYAQASARQAVPGEFNMKVRFITFFRAAITSRISLSPMMTAICF
jgi:hypothetical protein